MRHIGYEAYLLLFTRLGHHIGEQGRFRPSSAEPAGIQISAPGAEYFQSVIQTLRFVSHKHYLRLVSHKTHTHAIIDFKVSAEAGDT